MERIVRICGTALLSALAAACSASRPTAGVGPSDASVTEPGPSDASVTMPTDGGADAPDLGHASDILVPAHGALLGHYYGAGSLSDTDARIGRKPAIHLVYYNWVTDWSTDPVTLADFADGRI